MKVLSLAKKSFLTFQKNRGTLVSAGIAFYALLSASPLFVAVVAIAGILLGTTRVKEEIRFQVSETLGPEAASELITLIDKAHRPSGLSIATVLAVIVLLFAASRLFSEMRAVLNQIWGIEPAEDLPWYRYTARVLKKRLIGILLVLVSGVVMMLVILWKGIAYAFAALLPNTVSVSDLSARGLYFFGAFVLLTLLIALVFRWLPDADFEWSRIAVGSIVTSALFILGSSAVAMYLQDVATLSAYGGAGTVAIVLLWAYYSAQVFVFGAAFTRHWGEKQHNGE